MEFSASIFRWNLEEDWDSTFLQDSNVHIQRSDSFKYCKLIFIHIGTAKPRNYKEIELILAVL